ncbi:hypothetical protein HU200_042760 [Digitaria exilis]|uniref:Rx N-terminal domain-containing protein n=1 Tax=Digitaria exilis TaxID=1010633 RepID=A0A835ECS7_9POAL|nr:hypothetical protein HU200_042760 [Digitaria exilis]
MAESVLGLAKSAVSGAVTMAKSAMEEEEKLKKSVKRDLMLISDEFEMMHSFLNVVTKEAAADDMTLTSVRQVRGMALDVEDFIESVVYLDNKSSWWRRMLPSCLPAHAPAAPLSDAVAGIELLKSRVEAMGQRNMRYGHFGKSSGGGGSSVPGEPRTHLQQQLLVANPTALGLLTEAKGSGYSFTLDELINKRQDSFVQLQVISVWEVGGDTMVDTVIMDAYRNQDVCRNFPNRAWVKLMHPFDPLGFIRSLLIKFYRNSCCQQQQGIPVGDDALVSEFMKLVRSQSYLVVLEDLSTMDEWDAVRAYLPDMNNGSCVIVKNQELDIASSCVGHPCALSVLKSHSESHSVCAFFKEVCMPCRLQIIVFRKSIISFISSVNNWSKRLLCISRYIYYFDDTNRINMLRIYSLYVIPLKRR